MDLDAFAKKFGKPAASAEPKPAAPVVTPKPSTALAVAKPNPLMTLHTQEIESKATVPVQASGTDVEPIIPETDFKARLDKLDEMIMSENGITLANMDLVRGYVKTIFIQLQKEPELDSILIDRDVHNIMAFIRHVRVDAAAALVKKTEKTGKTVARKGKTTNLANKLVNAFEGMDLKDLAGFK